MAFVTVHLDTLLGGAGAIGAGGTHEVATGLIRKERWMQDGHCAWEPGRLTIQAMSFNPVSLLLLLAAGLLAVGSVYLLRRVNAARAAAWAEFARGHGMSARGLRLEGTCDGLPLTVEALYLSAGRGKYIATVLRLRVDALLPPGFFLEREGLADRVPRRVGQGEPESANARFDAPFDERVREHLDEMARTYTAFRIRDGWIEAERHRVPASVDELEAFTRPALMLALTLKQLQREHPRGPSRWS